MDLTPGRDRLLDAARAHRRAPAVPHPHIARQQEYRGGWPLGYTGAECPAYAPSACTVRYGFANLNCCPRDQNCQNDVLSIYCCPTTADCHSAAVNRPVCANSTWDMYAIGGKKYFCCPKSYFGVLPVDGDSGLCEPNVDGLPASRIASLVTIPTGAPTGTGSGSPSTPEGSGTAGSNSGGGSSGGDPLSSPSSPSSLSPSGISAGAIAGIVIGGVILLAASLAVILWLHRRSLRKVTVGKPQGYDAGLAPGATTGQHQGFAGPAGVAMAMPPPQYSRSHEQPELLGSQMTEMPTNRA